MVKPLGDFILVRIIDSEKEVGDILLPDIGQERPTLGEVVELGSGVLDKYGDKIEFEVRKGDKVLMPKYGGDEVVKDGKKYFLTKERNILGVFDE